MKLRFTLFAFLFSVTTIALKAQNWVNGGNALSADGSVGTNSSHALIFKTGATEKARLTSGGNWGVGTPSPLTRFHVNGFGAFGNRVTAANATRALNLIDDNAVMRVLRVHSSFAPAVELISRTTADGANVAYWDFYAEPTDKSFRVRDRVTGANLDRLTISSAGNVGIGTTAPNQRLDVGGSANLAGELFLRGNRFLSRGPEAAINNTFVGVGAGAAVTSGQNNTAVGTEALFQNSTGASNTALGSSALRINSNGFNNTALGHYSLYYNTTGYQNTAAGYSSLVSNSTGNFNTGFGMWTLFYNQTGSFNTALGYGAADNTYGYSDATFLGANTRANDNLTNITAVGFGARSTASNQVMLGNTSITAVVAAGSYMIYSDGRFKKDIKESVPGLAFINKLRPVTYHYNIQGLNSHLRAADKVDKERLGADVQQENRRNEKEEENIRKKEGIPYSGFVAQEVEKAAGELNYRFSGIHKPTNEKDVYALSYAEFVVPLVKAVQELSKENEELKKKTEKISELKEENAEIKRQLAELKSLFTSNGNNNISLHVSSAYLEQNTPNPSRGTTTIRYSVPDGTASARLTLTNSKGQLLKTVNLNGKGAGQVSLDTSALSAGVYNYTLWVAGREVDTKQLVITR